jgi:hypothetical protein
VPEDILWEWLEVIKAAQAACKNNQGFARFTLTVSVHKNKPVLWAPAWLTTDLTTLVPPAYSLLKLSPKRVADYEFTAETAATLMALDEQS